MRMYRNDRPIDTTFGRAEQLFFRCKLDWIDDTQRIKPAKVHFPDQSVNREKYSRPTDVLLPDSSPRSKEWIVWGVAVIRVCDIPPASETSAGVSYAFTAEHDPDDDNYGHTELRVYKNGQRESNKKKINETIKKEYRTNLALRSAVTVQPLV